MSCMGRLCAVNEFHINRSRYCLALLSEPITSIAMSGSAYEGKEEDRRAVTSLDKFATNVRRCLEDPCLCGDEEDRVFVEHMAPIF